MMRPILIVELLSGALLMGYAVAGLFFLRFWRETHDRLFGFFALAFFLLSIQRLVIATTDTSSLIYLVRLAAFVVILVAIVDKNRRE